jgi:hypothetical protein
MGDGGVYLARLASTEQQHLDFVLRHNFVSPELVLDLFIACGGVRMREISWLRGLKGDARALASSSTTDD